MTSPIQSRSESNSSYDPESFETLTCREPPKPTSSIGADEDAACHLTSGGSEEPATTSPTAVGGTGGVGASKGVAGILAAVDGCDVGREFAQLDLGEERNGGHLEVLSAAGRCHVAPDAKIGDDMQLTAQVGLGRFGLATADGSATVRYELLTAKFHAGTENPDGTKGFNVGLGATLAGVEHTTTDGSNSAAWGASIGATVAGSIGLGDRDGDGVPEGCFRAEGGPWTVAGCVEKFW